MVLSLCLSICGCANVTTTRIKRTAHGLEISSGKDVSFGSLEYRGTNGEHLAVSNYTANANAEAIKAQGSREAAVMQETRQMLKDAYEAGKALGTKSVTGGVAP